MKRIDRKFASRGDPCEICNRPDFCSRAEDRSYYICRRTGCHPVFGVAQLGSDRLGPYYFFRSPAGYLNSLPKLAATSSLSSRKRADDVVLDSVYTWLLTEILTLTPEHRQHLRGTRGFYDDEIDYRQYRSMPALCGAEKLGIGAYAELVFGRRKILSVPGFATEQGEGVYFTSAPGLVIPVRDDLGRIVALKIRRDEVTVGARFLSISSSRYGGPGPGARAHVPLSNEVVTEEVVLTEGELKADIATTRSGRLTLSCPGVSTWEAVLPALMGLQVKAVTIAFDSDARTNRRVADALVATFTGLKERGYKVKISTWKGSSYE
jgi:DNA primase